MHERRRRYLGLAMVGLGLFWLVGSLGIGWGGWHHGAPMRPDAPSLRHGPAAPHEPLFDHDVADLRRHRGDHAGAAWLVWPLLVGGLGYLMLRRRRHFRQGGGPGGPHPVHHGPWESDII